jgi:hypothetical protein
MSAGCPNLQQELRTLSTSLIASVSMGQEMSGVARQ